MIFPCHPSCTVVSSYFPLLGGNVELTAVRAAAESVQRVRRVLTGDRGLSDEGFYNYMSIGLFLFLGVLVFFSCNDLSEACKED